VDRQLENYLEGHGIRASLGVHERILVCVTPHSNGQAMIASGARNRDRFHGQLHVLYVRQPRLSSTDKARVESFLEMGRTAGATVVTLQDDDPVKAILEYAGKEKITQIFVGHSQRHKWLNRLSASPLDRLLRGAEQMDVRIFPQ
jgi:two-component system sensor histidine kinase KdpD